MMVTDFEQLRAIAGTRGWLVAADWDGNGWPGPILAGELRGVRSGWFRFMSDGEDDFDIHSTTTGWAFFTDEAAARAHHSAMCSAWFKRTVDEARAHLREIGADEQPTPLTRETIAMRFFNAADRLPRWYVPLRSLIADEDGVRLVATFAECTIAQVAVQNCQRIEVSAEGWRVDGGAAWPTLDEAIDGSRFEMEATK